MNDIPCILCGSKRSKTVYDFGQYRLLKCLRCRLITLDPKPSGESIAHLYELEYFLYHLPSQLPNSEREVEAEIWNHFYFVEWFCGLTNVRKGKLLEVGCGTGFLLKAFERAGWSVVGIDISQDASSYARERLHIDVRTNVALLGVLEDEFFDTIIMKHSLEHHQDPVTTLEFLWGHLREDGYIVVQVPNIDSLDACLHGKSWEGLRIPYHLYHFSQKTLQLLLEKTGYRIVYRDYSLPSFERRVLEWLKDSRSRCTKRSVHRAFSELRPISPLYRLRKRLLRLNKSFPLGRDVTVVARKIN